MSSAIKRLDILKRLLTHAGERLSFDVAFDLWDGSTVPIRSSPSELAIAIADEGVIAALVRRPKLNTLINLRVTARLDIPNGSIFDLVARRPKVRTKATLKALDKRLPMAAREDTAIEESDIRPLGLDKGLLSFSASVAGVTSQASSR